MSAEVAAFVSARLDERAALARAAIEPGEMYPWGDPNLTPMTTEQVPDAVRDYLGGTWGEHFAANDPAHVLREVAAMRAIVERYKRNESWLNMRTLVEPARDKAEGRRDAALEAVALLAAIWDAHPDYNQAWKVQQ